MHLSLIPEPEEDDDNVFEDPEEEETATTTSSPALLQFTQSLTAINSLVVGVRVMQAKKAFLSKLYNPRTCFGVEKCKAGGENLVALT